MPNEPSNPNPFSPPVKAQPGGLVTVEQQRAIAQVQAAMIVARANPRDAAAAMDLILADCQRPGLAEDATYEYNRGGTDITGPSIRLAETIARRWGNIECGVQELSRRDGFSECVAYAWDMETNFRDSKTFQVKHWRDTKRGGYAITEERDIYETVANQGARRKRACILAIIPADVIELALAECDKTLRQKIKITDELLDEMLQMFKEYGVTKELIEKRIQRHLKAITAPQAIQMRRIYTSLKDGMSHPADWFDMPPAADGTEPPKSGVAGAKAAAKAAAKDEKKAEDPAATVAEIKGICERAVKTADTAVALTVLDEARDLARGLKGAHRSNADLAIDQAKEELDKRPK